MSISLKTHKMLWGRAANRCSFSSCRCELVMDASETDDESLVGEECHIVARELNGPRGESPLSSEARDKYNNLILLCRIHHKLIDDQPNTYTIDDLKEIKFQHERWVRDSLKGYDSLKQRDDELYAALIDDWMKYVDLDNWEDLCFGILEGRGSTPCMTKEQSEKIDELSSWLFRRIWPDRYLELKAAFINFENVLRDFIKTFGENVEYWGEDIRIPKFYLREWNPPLYEKLRREYNFHMYLVEDLMLELTRAVNYICDKIRHFIDPTFRMKEGLVLAAIGATANNPFALYQSVRTEYRGAERTLMPYPGLEQFKEIRKSRDCCNEV